MLTPQYTGTIPNIDQLVNAVQKSTAYGLLWNGDEPWDVLFAAQRFTFPAKDQVAAAKGILDRPVYDADGDPIPGSLMLEDIRGEEGTDEESKIMFDARKAVVKWLGLPEKFRGQIFKQRATPLLKAGLRLLPPTPTKKQIAELRVSGEQAWEDYKDELAKLEIMTQQRARALGNDRSYDDKYEAAERRLKARSERLSNREKVMLGIEQQNADLNAGELDILVTMEASLTEMMVKKGYKDAESNTVAAKKLLEDPRVRQALKKDYRIRKVGRAFEKDEDLESQVKTQIIEEAKAAEAEFAELKEPAPEAEAAGVET